MGLPALPASQSAPLSVKSVWAMRGLDPIFQCCARCRRFAWLPIALAAFRDSQPSAVFVIFITPSGDHHQYRGRYPKHSGRLRNVAQVLRSIARVLRQDHVARRSALHLYRPSIE